MRVISPPAIRGSQKWIQIAVNEKQSVIDAAILDERIELKDQTIDWVSPLKVDDYAEYHDGEFLARLNIELNRHPLSSFWPHRGPQWDGLGKTQNGTVLLVEAKAHLAEIKSPASQAGETSRKVIEKSFAEVKSFLGVEPSVDWTGLYYQYANRGAHLSLLRELNNIPTYLIFLCFLKDKEMNGPTAEDEWNTAIHEIKNCLGLPARHKLSDSILHIYIDVAMLH